jgi:electron transport complex protein RnfG
MNQDSHSIIRSSALLGIIALIGTALLATVNELTYERIIEQEKQRVLQQLNEVVPASLFNNDLIADVIEVEDEAFFEHPAPVTIYRARMDAQAVAVMMVVTAPDGYNGDIRILAGIDTDGTILGVRVISHKETPGLGDPIEIEKSGWILGFSRKSLRNPQNEDWTVRRDGGEFDQFTGATISPRAVVKAVHRALQYFEANKQMLFDAPAKTVTPDV